MSCERFLVADHLQEFGLPGTIGSQETWQSRYCDATSSPTWKSSSLEWYPPLGILIVWRFLASFSTTTVSCRLCTTISLLSNSIDLFVPAGQCLVFKPLGCNLLQVIEFFTALGRFMPPVLVRKYTRQLCEGVQYLHEHSVIHTDFKLENILLDVQAPCVPRSVESDFRGTRTERDMTTEELAVAEKAWRLACHDKGFPSPPASLPGADTLSPLRSPNTIAKMGRLIGLADLNGAASRVLPAVFATSNFTLLDLATASTGLLKAAGLSLSLVPSHEKSEVASGGAFLSASTPQAPSLGGTARSILILASRAYIESCPGSIVLTPHNRSGFVEVSPAQMLDFLVASATHPSRLLAHSSYGSGDGSIAVPPAAAVADGGGLLLWDAAVPRGVSLANFVIAFELQFPAIAVLVTHFPASVPSIQPLGEHSSAAAAASHAAATSARDPHVDSGIAAYLERFTVTKRGQGLPVAGQASTFIMQALIGAELHAESNCCLSSAIIQGCTETAIVLTTDASDTVTSAVGAECPLLCWVAKDASLEGGGCADDAPCAIRPFMFGDRDASQCHMIELRAVSERLAWFEDLNLQADLSLALCAVAKCVLVGVEQLGSCVCMTALLSLNSHRLALYIAAPSLRGDAYLIPFSATTDMPDDCC